MNWKMVPSPVGDKLLSQWAERVSSSWNNKLFNAISCLLFKAQPRALFIAKPRPYHYMQWTKECSLHSSPYYSTNSSINWCFHSITAKLKSPHYKWGMRAVRSRPSPFGQPSQDDSLTFQSAWLWSISDIMKSGFQLLHLLLWCLISSILNQITRNQLTDHREKQWENPFQKPPWLFQHHITAWQGNNN